MRIRERGGRRERRRRRRREGKGEIQDERGRESRNVGEDKHRVSRDERAVDN